MATVQTFFCNLAYSDDWYDDVRDSNPIQFAVIEAIIEEIEFNDGGDIDQSRIFERASHVAAYVREQGFKIIPSNGQQLAHNGRGIRHAKYAPTKSVAVLWEKIGDTIFVTFDDHAPVRYHRAIFCLSELRLGRCPLPQRSRNSQKFMRKVKNRQTQMGKLKGINLRRRHYR